MKVLLVLFGTLATFVHYSTSTKMMVKSIANKEEYLKSINDLRRKYAKDSRIPNMHKLIWDDYLETKAQFEDWSEDKKTNRGSRRDGNTEAEDLRKSQIKYHWPFSKRKETINDSTVYHMIGNEDLTPHQKRIGCAPAESEEKRVNGAILKFKTLCFLAPEGTFDSWNMEVGDAGSKCTEGYENNDGLCSPVEKSEKVSGGGSLENSQNGTATISSGINEKTYGISFIFLVSVIHTMF
ncbi:hypothetical protein GCK72_015171 [Caenorhabditis remanei]|uniref:SCP domain-containing protein n=1 Tax=Caenorhabditis remanei TaxID=31234 RepID=A0A6A5GVS9_CAERE|nr:hypothetical protein GCK72_015171 [Caenorhabditis remanei]KAF1758711.1 hypothetical protein GCK72_015171 [Caenorhabditis remanei]